MTVKRELTVYAGIPEDCYVTFDQYTGGCVRMLRGVVSLEGMDLAFSQLFELRSHLSHT